MESIIPVVGYIVWFTLVVLVLVFFVVKLHGRVRTRLGDGVLFPVLLVLSIVAGFSTRIWPGESWTILLQGVTVLANVAICGVWLKRIRDEGRAEHAPQG